MLHVLLARAREESGRGNPEVRAAALLRIARVETAIDGRQARKTFETGLEETRRLPGINGEFLVNQARLLAAAVAPDLVKEITAAGMFPDPFFSERAAQIMVAHGHAEAAFEHVMACKATERFPFSVVAPIMLALNDDGSNLALMRRALEAWRVDPHGDLFIMIFQTKWKVLPEEEAKATVREIVRVALERDDRQISASYDPENTVQITSLREHTLFRVLHVLRHLDAPLAESLINTHAQLAAAALRFPNGMDSVMEEAEKQRNASGASCGGGFVMAGDGRNFPYMKALMQAGKDGDFTYVMEHAWEQYREDTGVDGPNQAPREFWPSTNRFRSILYSAGKMIGNDAAAFLDRIPDDDLRLFAMIELAAALAGLPQFQETNRGYRQGRDSLGPNPRKGVMN